MIPGGDQPMKTGIAWVALLCVTASGCAGTGMFGDRCGGSCQVARSQRAPRPQIYRDACVSTAGGLFGGSSCDDGCCGDGCCGDCGGRRSLGDRMGRARDACGCIASGWDDRCRQMVGKVAGGMCDGCSDGCGGCGRMGCAGLCPHSGGYPESPGFAGSGPVGQVAYPYYTTRGPRDFLQNNPTRIGPY